MRMGTNPLDTTARKVDVWCRCRGVTGRNETVTRVMDDLCDEDRPTTGVPPRPGQRGTELVSLSHWVHAEPEWAAFAEHRNAAIEDAGCTVERGVGGLDRALWLR